MAAADDVDCHDLTPATIAAVIAASRMDETAMTTIVSTRVNPSAFRKKRLMRDTPAAPPRLISDGDRYCPGPIRFSSRGCDIYASTESAVLDIFRSSTYELVVFVGVEEGSIQLNRFQCKIGGGRCQFRRFLHVYRFSDGIEQCDDYHAYQDHGDQDLNKGQTGLAVSNLHLAAHLACEK